jgi:ABC-type polysaccharide/polyol phosphate transport system ATPase subunit
MAADTVISVQGLGKSYLVGHEAAALHRYVALRDVLARATRNLVRKTRDMIQGRPIVQGDEVEEFWALKDVTFDVSRGDVIGVIGRNGAGKSTLLKVLSRITEPNEGRVEITGRVASLLEVGTGFHPELTGRENIYLNGAILGMARAEIRSKFDEIVAFAEIERFLDTPVKRYSSGMYVRLAFAVAAHLEPEILVVDEVLAVGDSEFQKKCLGKMRDVAGHGRTVLFVSHNMAAVRALCRSCILLRSGKLAAIGDPSTVIAQYVIHESESLTFEREPIKTERPYVAAASIETIEQDEKGGRRILKVRVAANSQRSMSVEISALIRDNMGATIGFAPVGSLISQAPAHLEVGTTTFILSIDITHLALGQYNLTLQISRPLSELIDIAADCLSFDLGSEHFAGVIHPFRQDWQVAACSSPARSRAHRRTNAHTHEHCRTIRRMKNLIREMLQATAPSLVGQVRALRSRRHEARERERMTRVLDAITRSAGYVVQRGPFKGMRYVVRTKWTCLPAKLLGIYERELGSVVTELLARSYNTIINVGSAEGYYAIGFARQCAGSNVVAYEMDPDSRTQCAEMALLNEVSGRVEIGGECTHAELDARISGRTLVIVDCEGCEQRLLDPLRCPKLANADLLVELHEFVSEGLTDAVLSRFGVTHSIRRIPAVAAGAELAGDLPLSNADRLFAVSEFRPAGMEWALLTTKTRQA